MRFLEEFKIYEIPITPHHGHDCNNNSNIDSAETKLQSEIDVNSIFWEALIGFIISFITISLFGFDVPELLGGLVLLIGLMGAMFTLTSHPLTDVSTMTINLTNFIVPWVLECVKISLGAAFGTVFGTIVNAALQTSGLGR
jgi:hypothetical protein